MSECPRCHATFLCGKDEETEDEACWCMSMAILPAGKIDPRYPSCLCPACLHHAADRLDDATHRQ